VILDLGHFRFGNDQEQESSVDSNSNLVEDDMEDDGTIVCNLCDKILLCSLCGKLMSEI